MHILHVLFTNGWGGLEKYAIEQAERMARKGHEVEFLVKSGTPACKVLQNSPILSVQEIQARKYIDIRAMATIRRMCVSGNIEIVHVHSSGDLGLVAPALWRLPAVKLVFSSYMRIPSPKQDLYHRFEYGRVDKVLVASKLLRQNAIDNLPINPGKIDALPYGLDLKRFDPGGGGGSFRKRFTIGPNAPLIGVISRLEPLKGQMELIGAMPLVLEKHPSAMLALVGDETPEFEGVYKKELEARITALRLSQNVIFTGYAKDTSEVLRDLTIYVLPSHTETYSLGCLEAMLMGKPVVGANGGGVPEMLENGNLGLLADPKNREELAGAILRFLDEPQLQVKLGNNARARVAERHEEKRVTLALEKEYLSLSPKGR